MNEGSPTDWRPDNPLPLLTSEEHVRSILRALAPAFR
jgi:hypothetical protein